MASPESAIDPLTEHDNLTSELANLEKQFADRKVQEKEFQLLSKQLRERIQKAELQAYNLARTDESIARKLRLRNFNNPTIQQVISNFLNSGGKPLEPFFGPDRIPRYPIKTETGETVTVERAVFQKMADIGMVTETLYERMVSCPKCGTPTNV